MQDIVVFSGSANQEFAQEMCDHLDLELHPAIINRFANQCLEVQLPANCRERDVYIVQPIVPPTQENLMELLLLCNAAKGASARRVTAILPHFAYARSDKKDAPRISIGARLVADLMATAGADRVLAMTLHSPQVHGFFSMPVDHLHALKELARHFRQFDLSHATVLSPDLGNAKEAAQFARILGVDVAAAAKQRFPDDRVEISSIIGNVEGRDVIVLDDEIARGSTMIELLGKLKDFNPKSIRVACTHGLFSDGALKRLSDHEEVAEIVCTNTVPIDPAERSDKLTVLSVAPAMAEAVRRIHNGESVSALFDA